MLNNSPTATTPTSTPTPAANSSISTTPDAPPNSSDVPNTNDNSSLPAGTAAESGGRITIPSQPLSDCGGRFSGESDDSASDSEDSDEESSEEDSEEDSEQDSEGVRNTLLQNSEKITSALNKWDEKLQALEELEGIGPAFWKPKNQSGTA